MRVGGRVFESELKGRDAYRPSNVDTAVSEPVSPDEGLSMGILRQRLWLKAVVFCMLLFPIACTDEQPATRIDIASLSNRADLISGGDSLIEVQLTDSLSLKELSVDLNGEDISHRLQLNQDGSVLVLVDGLKICENVITAWAGDVSATLALTNYPRGGPVFSGPQIQPWVCATPEAHPGDDDTPFTVASGLGSIATDAQCNIAAEIKHYYRTTERCGRDPKDPRRFIPCFKPYDPQAERPADLAETSNQQGESVPYVVRVERGTINRGIYDIAVLDEPGSAWGPFHHSATWNRALVHQFGGGTGRPRRQYPPNSSWAVDEALSRGFMVSVSSLTDHALNANKVVAAEMVMMLKEHITENYGEVSRTIGAGCSGGSIMQLVIAGTYPGLLDGIQPACTYPDSLTTLMELTDCVLLANYFDSDEFAALTRGSSESSINTKKAALAGHLDANACLAWARSFGSSTIPGNYTRGDQEMNNCRLPRNWVFDRESNPDGIRCSMTDHEIALWGHVPGENYGRNLSDNLGILYGLKALESGAISAEEFVSLNENIGGRDIDARLVPVRMKAREDSVRLAYRMGLVTDARQWAKVPIIDLRGNDNSGIHMNWRAFAVRERLDRQLGSHENHVIWRFGPDLWPPPESNMVADALEVMDEWLRAIKADATDVPVEEKVVRNRPETAYDFCYIGDDYTRKITDETLCNADPALAYYSSPRQVAGGPLAENVLKCSLKPLVRTDYGIEFDDSQWSRLRAVFPDGVCDWSGHGVGMQPAKAWLDYSAGPGGHPLPLAPTSTSPKRDH